MAVEYKNADLMVTLVRDEGILLCAVSGCAEALGSPLAPAALGWVLVDGWWYCPSHVPEVVS